jgi:octopine/nopaline transport system permease protein
MIDLDFLGETLASLMSGVPLTLRLAAISLAAGAVLALLLALMRLSGVFLLERLARVYVFVFRGSPLLVQIFLIYYGLGQFTWIRTSLLWPFLREPFWCAVLALSLNTAAYGSEILRGGLSSVPHGQIEAARAVGMSRLLMFRRVMLPLALRQALPAYGNEMVLMVKATSLASIITLLEITGIAAKIISETYRAIEVFIVAGALYLALNFALTRILLLIERRLTPDLATRPRLAPFSIEEAGR